MGTVPNRREHITVLMFTDMERRRFRAFTVHIYIDGTTPGASYDTFDSNSRTCRQSKKVTEAIRSSKEWSPATTTD